METERACSGLAERRAKSGIGVCVCVCVCVCVGCRPHAEDNGEIQFATCLVGGAPLASFAYGCVSRHPEGFSLQRSGVEIVS